MIHNSILVILNSCFHLTTIALFSSVSHSHSHPHKLCSVLVTAWKKCEQNCGSGNVEIRIILCKFVPILTRPELNIFAPDHFVPTLLLSIAHLLTILKFLNISFYVRAACL